MFAPSRPLLYIGSMYHECPCCGCQAHLAAWGPIQLISHEPIDSDKLHSGDFDAWLAIGMLLDITAMELAELRRHVRVFQALLHSESRSRVVVDLDLINWWMKESGPIVVWAGPMIRTDGDVG
jgi:hypothetical protein